MKLVLQLSANALEGLESRRNHRQDFFATADVRDPDGGAGWVELGKTEVVYNSSSPSWATTFNLDYSFNATQLLRFRVLRVEPVSAGGQRKFKALGEVQCTVAIIVLSEGKVAVERLRPISQRRIHFEPRPAPTLKIRAEEERGDLGDSVTLQFAASNLRRGFRPFYTLKRENADHSFSPVQFSEVHRNYDGRRPNLFKPLTISLAKLVNSDLGRLLRIEFSEYDRGGQHYRGGHADFTLNMLNAPKEAKRETKFELIKLKSNGSRKPAGIVKIVKFEITNSFTFLDYIAAGVEINAVIAIDMSSTNGNPGDPRSLQYNSRTSPNEYVVALRKVGAVLAEYDTDKKFPAYGFSACLPPDFHYMSYCFALSGKANLPQCDGIEGVVSAYYESLDHVAPHQPCYMNPVIQHVVEETKRKDAMSMHSAYTVLLLITDGDYRDQSHVADTICAATDLPLSIVIVGIGNSEFPLLDELDGDEIRLCNSDGVPAARDIVQVVHYHKHRNSAATLARETLAEIPAQLISYMRNQGLRPDDISAIRRRVPSSSEPALDLSVEPPVDPPTPEPPSAASSLLNEQDLHINIPDGLAGSDSRHSFYSASSDGTAATSSVPQPPPPAPYINPPTHYHSPVLPPAEPSALPPSAQHQSILTLNLPTGFFQHQMQQQVPMPHGHPQARPHPHPHGQHPHPQSAAHMRPPPGPSRHQPVPPAAVNNAGGGFPEHMLQNPQYRWQ